MKIKEKMNSRRLRYGGLSLAITAVFTAVVIVVNVALGVASEKLPLTVDLTQNKAFELSQTSIDFLATVQKPIDVTVFIDGGQLESSGGYTAQAKSLIDQYAKHSSQIAVEYIDPVKNPAYAAKYPDLSPEATDIVVASGEKNYKLGLNDLFNVQYDQYSGQQYIASSKAEQAMTSALMRVTSDKVTKILLLTGHDETYPDTLKSFLDQNGYETAEQSLVTGELDQETEIAFLLSPQRDLDKEALDKLDAYLTNGGKYGKNLIFAPSPTVQEQTNLLAYLSQWGVKFGSGVVMETDSTRYMNGLPYLAITDFANQDYTKNLTTSAQVLSPRGVDIQIAQDSMRSCTTDVLLNYSAGSFVLPQDAAKDAAKDWQLQETDLGVRPALIRSTFTKYDQTVAQMSRVFTVASAASFDTPALTSNSVANASYYTALLGSLSGQTNAVSIEAKTLGGLELGINQFQFLLFGALFVIIIPAAVVITGLVVWLRKRNR